MYDFVSITNIIGCLYYDVNIWYMMILICILSNIGTPDNSNPSNTAGDQQNTGPENESLNP